MPRYINTIKLPNDGNPLSDDHVTWRVYGITNSQPQGFYDYTVNPVTTKTFDYPWPGGMAIEAAGVPVQLRLKAVDGSGNESGESVLDYLSSDTTPPPTPGPMEVVGSRQE